MKEPNFLDDINPLNTLKGTSYDTAQFINHVNEFTIPPDLDLCRMHEKVTSVCGIEDSKDRVETGDIRRVKKFGICVDPERFAPMGFGYSLFFFALKFTIIFAVFPVACFGGWEMYNNYKGKQECVASSDITRLSEQSNTLAYTSDAPTILLRFMKIENRKIFADNYCKAFRIIEDPQCKIYKDDLKCIQYTDEKTWPDLISKDCDDIAKGFIKGSAVKLICIKDWSTAYSAANRGEDYTQSKYFGEFRPWLIIVLMTVMMLMAFILIYWINKRSRDLNSKYLTFSDYSVKLIGLPTEFEDNRNGQFFRRINQALIKNGFPEASDIVPTYHIVDFLEGWREYTQKVNYFTKNNFSKRIGREDQDLLGMLPVIGGNREPTQNDLLTKDIEFEEKNSKNVAAEGEHFSGTAIISFETPKSATEFVDKFKKTGLTYSLCGVGGDQAKYFIYKDSRGYEHTLHAEKAAEPRDMYWENLHFTKFQTFFRGMLITFIAGVIMIFALLIMVSLKLFVDDSKSLTKDFDPTNQVDWFIVNAINFGIILIIPVANAIIKLIIMKITPFWKAPTRSQESINIVKLLWKAQFIVAALVPVLIAITISNYFGTGGLIKTIDNVLLFSIYLNPVVGILVSVAMDCLRRWKISRIEKFVENPKEGNITNQGEANLVFQKAEWDIAYKYVELLKNVALVLFYLPLFPMGGLYLVPILIIQFWSEKYILINYSSRVAQYSEIISEALLNELFFCVFIFGMGLIWEATVFHNVYGSLPQTKNQYWVILIIFIALLAYLTDIADMIVDSHLDERVNSEPYSMLKAMNDEDYSALNPAGNLMARTNGKAFVKPIPLSIHLGNEEESQNDNLSYSRVSGYSELSARDSLILDRSSGQYSDDSYLLR